MIFIIEQDWLIAETKMIKYYLLLYGGHFHFYEPWAPSLIFGDPRP